MENEKWNLLYVIDGEEANILYANHFLGMRKVVDNVDAHVCTYHEPLKKKKINIDTEEEPKEAIIGDYWLEKEVSRVIYLLCKFEDLFLHGYHELKGIHHSFREMRIKLKDGARLVRKRPYQMNPNLCVKVKE